MMLIVEDDQLEPIPGFTPPPQACPFCAVVPEVHQSQRGLYASHGEVGDDCPMAGALVPLGRWNHRTHLDAATRPA